MSPMSSTTSEVGLCPRCLCAINPHRRYNVDIYFPAHYPFPPNVPTDQPLAVETTAHSSPPLSPAPPYESLDEQDPVTHDESRRLSSSSYDSAFTQFSIDAEFAAELTAIGERDLAQQAAQVSARSPPTPPASPPLPPTSPPPHPTSSPSLTSSSVEGSSPSVEPLSTLPESDEPPFTARRWVVFRGHIPGIYTSS